jgi:hypothetical protein
MAWAARAADLVVLLHFAFVLFVIAGGLLVLRWPRLLPLHVAAVIWGAAIEFGGWICPLTPLENHLRDLAGGNRYEGGFVEHYIVPVLYPAALTRSTQLGLGALVVVLNAAVYWIICRNLRAGHLDGRNLRE